MQYLNIYSFVYINLLNNDAVTVQVFSTLTGVRMENSFIIPW